MENWIAGTFGPTNFPPGKHRDVRRRGDFCSSVNSLTSCKIDSVVIRRREQDVRYQNVLDNFPPALSFLPVFVLLSDKIAFTRLSFEKKVIVDNLVSRFCEFCNPKSVIQLIRCDESQKWQNENVLKRHDRTYSEMYQRWYAYATKINSSVH